MGRKPCCERLGLKRGRWMEEEDAKLIKYVEQNGEGSWSSLPGNAGLLRCGKSCRLRWTNYLRPNLEKGKFSSEEDDLIVRLHASLGSRWSLIARHLSGRTDNGIKNYWNSHLSRKIHPLWRRKIGYEDRSFLINGVNLDLPPSRLLWKENKTHIRKRTELQVHDSNVDRCNVNYVVPPSTTAEVIAMSDEAVSNPDAGNKEDNTEHVQETGTNTMEKEGEAEEGAGGSESNTIVTGDKMRAESEIFNVDGVSDLVGNEERESGDLSYLEMAEKWESYSSETRGEEDKILSWLLEEEEHEWEGRKKEIEFDSEKQEAMFAWLLS